MKSQPGSAAGHEVHGVAAQVNRLSREAEAAYTESLRLEPGRVPVMLRLGQLALEAREAKKAEGWFRKALAANPDLGAARRGLALSLLAQRQLRPALAEIQEALKRSDGRDMDAKYLLAQIMNDAGRPSAAEPVLDEVLAARPDHLPALLLQGLVKLELRKTDEAEALFARVVQRDPKSTQARLGLAIVERARGQLAPAATAIEGVIRDRPDWALAYLELGRTRLGLRQVDAALKAFDRAEQTSPDPAVMRVRAAQSLAAAGEIDRAIAKAQASLGSVNAAPLARTLLVRLYVEKGQPALAERELQASISAAPQEATPLLNLGRFYLAQRRPADAVAPLERAATLSPTLAEPLGMLVDAHIALGQKDQALAAGERLLRVQGETPAAYLIFGVVNEKLDRPAEALEAYQRALDKEPGHLAISRARASLLARQQRVPEAVRLLEDTADKNPKAPEPLIDLAQLEERTGNVPAAVAAYRRAVERAPDNAILLNNLAYLLSADPAARDEAVRLAERAQGLAPTEPGGGGHARLAPLSPGRSAARRGAARRRREGRARHPRGPLSPRAGLRQAGEGAGGPPRARSLAQGRQFQGRRRGAPDARVSSIAPGGLTPSVGVWDHEASSHEGPPDHARLPEESGRFRAHARHADRGRIPWRRRAEDAECVIVNTCAFIDRAREESIHTILELAKLKERGRAGALIVTGCLTQRYGGDILKEMPEVDGILGTSNLSRIVDLVRQAAGRHDWATSAPPGYLYDATTPRLLSEPRPLRLREDRRGVRHGLHLLRDPPVPWPSPEPAARRRGQGGRGAGGAGRRRRPSSSRRTRSPTDAICRATATSATSCWRSARRACPGSARCTCIRPTSTRRSSGGGRARGSCRTSTCPCSTATTACCARCAAAVTATRMKEHRPRFREAIPGVTVRTTVLVGFPGETEAAFENLLEFLDEVRFDRLGVFTYSAEEGTPAAVMADPVPAATMTERAALVEETQDRLAWPRQKALMARSLSMVWQSARTPFLALIGLQLLNAIALALQIVAVQLALTAVLEISGNTGDLWRLVQPVLLLAGLTAVTAVIASVQVGLGRYAGELVVAVMWKRVLRVATRVDLRKFESARFYDRLQRVQANALTRPYQITYGLVATTGAAAASAGLVIAIVLLHPALLPLLLVGAVPVLLTSRRQSQLEFDFLARQTQSMRLRSYLTWVQTGRRGAIDNASGTAGLLELARAMKGAKPGPARSVLFLFVTAEEQGLLGSTEYAERPLYPLAKTVAVLNLDALNVHGRTRDLTIIGLGLSDLDQAIGAAAAAQGRVVKPDPMPEKGSYFRSDHFPFARKGVPSIHAGGGIEFVGKPARVRNARPRGVHPERLPQAVGRGEARLGPQRRGRGPRPLPPCRVRARLGVLLAGVEAGRGVEGPPRRDDEGRGHALGCPA